MSDSAAEGRGGILRGIAVLASAAVLLGVFALGSADAKKKGFTKKKALKLFYTKDQTYDKGGADARFEEEVDVLWAKVTSAGDLLAGEGVTDTSRDDVGNYLVTFNRPQDPCARLATSNDDPDVIATVDGAPDPNAVRVELSDDDGNPIDHPFSVSLLC
jgi:hypothetical protein